jgi:hypothetical protein
MKKRILVDILLFIIFIAGFVWMFQKADFVLRQKQYAGIQDNFAKLEKDSVDLIFIGNSHQFCSISPQVLADEYGIESFMLSTSAQTIPMSYYAAMEAIELQHPETIVLEVSYCANDFRTVTDEMSHCFFDGMPNCKAKHLAIKDLIKEKDRIYYYLPMGLYHNRWKELTQDDFSITLVDERGGVHYEDVKYNGEIPLIGPEETETMPAEMEKYMDMLVALCQENDVQLILYVAPFNTLWGSAEEIEDLYKRERIFNYVGAFAEKYHVPYYNLFYEQEELGLNGETDWKDTQHLNYFGQQKLTRYMVEKGYLSGE